MSGVAVVIVNYRTADLAVDCLRALRDDCVDRVIVVDNASGDGSAELLAAALGEPGWAGRAELLALGRNGGFAAGNNAALRAILACDSPPDYVLLLNPDTVPRPNAVRRLKEFLDAHPKVGIAGSSLEGADGTAQTAAFRFPTVAGEFEHGLRFGPVTRLLASRRISMPIAIEPHPADWVSGASMMIRRAVFDTIGLLDEGYFLYYEEVDFCRRAARAGWTCWLVPQSRVVHLVSRSTGMDDPKSRRPMPDYWFASRRRYQAKHQRPLDAVCANLAWAAGFAGWRLRRRAIRHPDLDPPHFLGDFVRKSLLKPVFGRAATA